MKSHLDIELGAIARQEEQTDIEALLKWLVNATPSKQEALLQKIIKKYKTNAVRDLLTATKNGDTIEYASVAPAFSRKKFLLAVFVRLIFPPIIFWDIASIIANFFFGQSIANELFRVFKRDLKLKKAESKAAKNTNEPERLAIAVGNKMSDVIGGVSDAIKKLVTTSTVEETLSEKEKATKVNEYKKTICDAINKVEGMKKHLESFSITNTSVTHDNVTLEGIEIADKSQTKLAAKERKYLIYLPGAEGKFNTVNAINQFATWAEAYKCTVVAFHYRGLGKSSGLTTNKDHITDDAYVQIERLIQQGVPPENITIRGFSMGAPFAVLAAKKAHDRGQRVNVYADRGISTASNLVTGLIHILTVKAFSYITHPLVWLILKLVKWDYDAGDAFKQIPAECRDYSVVKPSEKRTPYPYDARDSVVEISASIHVALQSERRKQKKAIRKELDKEIQNLQNSEKESVLGLLKFEAIAKNETNNATPTGDEQKNTNDVSTKGVHEAVEAVLDQLKIINRAPIKEHVLSYLTVKNGNKFVAESTVPPKADAKEGSEHPVKRKRSPNDRSNPHFAKSKALRGRLDNKNGEEHFATFFKRNIAAASKKTTEQKSIIAAPGV